MSCMVFILSLAWEIALITKAVQNQWVSSYVMSCSMVRCYPLPPMLWPSERSPLKVHLLPVAPPQHRVLWNEPCLQSSSRAHVPAWPYRCWAVAAWIGQPCELGDLNAGLQCWMAHLQFLSTSQTQLTFLELSFLMFNMGEMNIPPLKVTVGIKRNEASVLSSGRQVNKLVFILSFFIPSLPLFLLHPLTIAFSSCSPV